MINNVETILNEKLEFCINSFLFKELNVKRYIKVLNISECNAVRNLNLSDNIFIKDSIGKKIKQDFYDISFTIEIKKSISKVSNIIKVNVSMPVEYYNNTNYSKDEDLIYDSLYCYLSEEYSEFKQNCENDYWQISEFII